MNLFKIAAASSLIGIGAKALLFLFYEITGELDEEPKASNKFSEFQKYTLCVQEYYHKSDNELEELAKSKDKIIAKAAKHILEQRKENAK